MSYKPGDVLPHVAGSILTSDGYAFAYGEVLLTRQQARLAAPYGWVVTANDLDKRLVRCVRTYEAAVNYARFAK